jgi:flagellar protein FlaG
MSEITAVGQDAPMTPAATYQARTGENTRSDRAPHAASRSLAPEQVNAVVKELNDAIKIINTSISFSVDKVTGKTVIKVSDADTKQVIRQIPSEEMMRVAERITQLLGVLFDKTQ